jgi:hypothetical protein
MNQQNPTLSAASLANSDSLLTGRMPKAKAHNVYSVLP